MFLCKYHYVRFAWSKLYASGTVYKGDLVFLIFQTVFEFEQKRKTVNTRDISHLTDILKPRQT